VVIPDTGAGDRRAMAQDCAPGRYLEKG